MSGATEEISRRMTIARRTGYDFQGKGLDPFQMMDDIARDPTRVLGVAELDAFHGLLRSTWRVMFLNGWADAEHGQPNV